MTDKKVLIYILIIISVYRQIFVKQHLESEEVIHSTDNDVDGCCAAYLCAQVVLKIWSTMYIIFKSSNSSSKQWQCLLQSKFKFYCHLYCHDSFSPLLCPSQSSCKKRKRSQVNSSSDITFSSKTKNEWGKVLNYILKPGCVEIEYCTIVKNS